MQGNQFTYKFYFLPFGRCDVVAEIQWLRTLGLVLWDFNNLTISFEHDKKSLTLRDMNSSKSKLVEDI